MVKKVYNVIIVVFDVDKRIAEHEVDPKLTVADGKTHEWQFELPSSGAKVSISQSVHCLCPGYCEKLPEGHFLHPSSSQTVPIDHIGLPVGFVLGIPDGCE